MSGHHPPPWSHVCYGRRAYPNNARVSDCPTCGAEGFYWLGMLGFALAAPAATHRAALIFEEIDPLWVDGVLRGRIYDAAYGWDPR